MTGTAYHIPGTNDLNKTVCGRPIEVAGRPQVLLTTNPDRKKGIGGTCNRCKALKAGAARTEKVQKKHERIRKAEEKSGFVTDVPYNTPPKAIKRQPTLLILGERMPRSLEVTFKGNRYVADVVQTEGMEGYPRRGVIRYAGQDFMSPSRAGKAVVGREVDGWTFWSFRNVAGELEKLDTLRKEVA